MAWRRRAKPQMAMAARHKAYPAPTAGWVTGANLATGPDGAARVLENFFPTSTGIQMRSGTQKHATAVADEPLESAFAYVGGTPKMFGACDGSIFDLTSVADPDVPPTAAVTGQTSNYYSTVNMPTSGGYFLLAANGSDDIQTFDGSTWSALVTGANPGELNGVDSDSISHLNVYRNRVWLVEDGTMDAWYLPTDSIAGTANRVALAGVFKKGGSLLFSATWSQDSGDGMDDRLVFVSTEGEVAIYAGDPADSAGWGLVGRYDAAKPLGKNAFENFGGDLVILTDLGLIPLSAIVAKDPADLSIAALSKRIQPDWLEDARARRNMPWEIVKWTSRNLAFITCPVTGEETDTPPWCYVVNVETGAWAKITGWNTRCFVAHEDWIYFGTNSGTLVKTEITGADQGELIYYRYVGQFDHFGEVGRYKTVRQARATFRTRHEINPQLSVATDYELLNLPAYPSAVLITDAPGEWDVGLWDVSLWDTGLEFFQRPTRWMSIGLSGEAHAPVLQMTSGGTIPPRAELVVLEVLYEPGNYVG